MMLQCWDEALNIRPPFEEIHSVILVHGGLRVSQLDRPHEAAYEIPKDGGYQD